MEYDFRIFFVILGIIGFMNCVMCLTEDEINKIVERKMKRTLKSMTERLLILRRKSMRKASKSEIWKRSVPLRRRMLKKNKRMHHYSTPRQIVATIPAQREIATYQEVMTNR